MQLNNIKPTRGAVHSKKRLGRGNASGTGTFCGRGCKGQGQRKSGNVRPGFEGGQTPLISRLPKLKGFTPISKIIYQVVNLKDLDNKYNNGEEVNVLTLLEKGLVTKKLQPVKILGTGNISKKITVKAHKISSTARAKILKAGGKII